MLNSFQEQGLRIRALQVCKKEQNFLVNPLTTRSHPQKEVSRDRLRLVGLNAITMAAKVITTRDFHIETTLFLTLTQNLPMVRDMERDTSND